MANLLITLAVIALIVWIVLLFIKVALSWIPLGLLVLFVVLWLVFR